MLLKKCHFYFDPIIIFDVRGGGGIGFVPPDRVLQARDGVARKSRFKNQINRNANNK